MKLTKYRKLSLHKNRTQFISASVVILAMTIVGVHLLIASHAQSPYISSQASSGSLAAPATVRTGSGAQYVQFGPPVYDGKLLSVQSTTADIPSLQQLHANSTRPEISLDTAGTAFSDIVAHDGNTTETMLDQMTTAHIEPVPLMDTYTPITPGSTVYIDPTIWANAIVSWCQVYCVGGSFYANNPSANSYYAPHVLEMLNEPYGNWYRGGAVPPQGYANMLIATRAALNNAGLSDIGILGAAGNAGDSTNAWTVAVAADGGYGAVEGLAVHPYSSGNTTLPAQPIMQDGWDTLYYLHQTYNIDIYVTEVGWCSQSTIDNAPCDGRNQPEADKDADITDAIDQLATVSWIKDFNYFDMTDFSECIAQTTGPCINEYYSYGLHLSNGSQTPAFGAYETAAIANGF